MDDNINSIKQFLNEFREVNSEENVKYRGNIISSYYMNPEDVKAEVLDWSLHYLEQKKCPYSLALMLAKLVAHQLSDSIYEMSLQAEEGIDDEDDKKFRYESSQLYSEMIECLSEAITNWKDHVDLNALKVEPPPYIVSSFAIKNTRRKMEDRHVIIHDLNAVCGLKDMPRHSYYAIFDGHAGVEAASYCAAHLHWNIANHPEFLTNTEKAISEAVILTDRNFLERSYREGIKGGCTALCCLIRDRIMYIAWVGDSQAVLVKQGTSVPIGLPHKPDREDERCRVEELGGCILFLGTWRVNGTLAVSRALGDAEHKPYISSEPEILKIPLDGTEEYVVLACDGLWDQLQPSDLGQVVYSHIIENAENVDEVASKLVQWSKSQGSTDNITTIVVFLKDPLSINKPDVVFSQLQDDNREKSLQIDGTSLPDAFLNSGERITQTVNNDVAVNGVSTTEQLKNELNSLNFPESTIEPVVLSHLQEKTLTSGTLEHYEESALLAYENPIVQNYCNRDVAFNNAQSTTTSLSNSVHSSISKISDSVDLNQHIIMDTEQQQCVNHTIIENTSHNLVTIANSTNICTKDTANLNQLITVGAENSIGTSKPNIDNLSEAKEHTSITELSDQETSTSSNDFIVLEEKSEPSSEAIMQSTEDLEINPNILLADMNKSKIIQLTEGTEEDVFRNNSEIVNLQMSESSYKTETCNVTSESHVNILGHTDNLCKKVSNVAISNNIQTEIKDSNSEILYSTNVEKSYKQEATSTLMLDEKLNLYNEKDQIINNNNFHLATEDPSKNESPNYAVLEFPSNHNPVIVKNISTHKIDSVVVANSLQAGNEVSDSALDKSNCLLHSGSETDSNKLELTEKCANIIDTELKPCNKTVELAINSYPKTEASGAICPDISFLENKQLVESDISSNNLYKEGVLLHSTNKPDFDKNESINEQVSQNYDNDTTDKLAAYNKLDNTIINNNYKPEVSNDESKTSIPFPSMDEAVLEKSEIVSKPRSENYGSILDNELSLHNKSSDTTIDINCQPNTDACSNSLNKEDSSLHTIDISDFNKYDSLPEFPSQDCINVIANNANLTAVQQNSEHAPILDLKSTTETCLSPGSVESDMLQDGYKITDVPIDVQLATEQDITENKILANRNENKHKVPLSLQTTTSTSPDEIKIVDGIQPKDDLTRQPKCDQVEKVQIFESPVISSEISSLPTSNNNTKAGVKSNVKHPLPQTTAGVKNNAKHPLPQTKSSIKTENNKTIYKKGTTKEPAVISSSVGNRSNAKHPLPQAKSSIKTENNKTIYKKGTTKEPAVTSSSVKTPAQKQMQEQLKVKQTVTNKDKTECQLGVQSTTAAKPKPIHPNVFERLSTPKAAFTKPKENKNGDSLHSSKGSDGTITGTKTVLPVSDIRARNNLSSSSKALGAVSKKLNNQPENIKSKTQTHSSIINNNKLSTKTPRLPLSNQVTANKPPRGNLPHKADHKALQQTETSNSSKKPSNTADASVVKKTNSSASRQDTIKQRPLIGTKTAERVIVSTSSRQATPLRPNVSSKLDIRQVTATNLQLHNSKMASSRSTRVALEKSSISSTKTKEGKTAVVKSASGQKKESNMAAKVEKSQIQKTSISTHKKSSMLNMDGQGDCITTNTDNRLPEASENDIELPNLNTSNSKEVPNPTLHI